MTNRTTNAMRMVLLVPFVLLLGITALLYFRTGKFDITSVLGAGFCLFIFIITKPRQVSGGSNHRSLNSSFLDAKTKHTCRELSKSQLTF